MPEVKRPNYFNHQFLDERDFQDEQAYHIGMRRLHNRLLHKWGIAEGLAVKHHGERTVVVEPGIAIDGQGREIALMAPVTREITHSGGTGPAFVTITYLESFHDEDKQSAGGAEGYRRVVESHEVHVRRQLPPEDGSAVVLARLHLDAEGRIREVDSSVRQHAGSMIAWESIGSRELAAGSVTEEKLSPELRAALEPRGWLRLPFKPVRLPPVRHEARTVRVAGTDADDFTVDIAYTYCGERGARGSMGIAVPAGVNRIRAFRMAGTTRGSVSAQLVRTGWNHQQNKGEYAELLNEIVTGPSFHHHVQIAEHYQHLNPELHTLALCLTADNEAAIWLVAVEVQ